jgi:hypothetical protein
MATITKPAVNNITFLPVSGAAFFPRVRPAGAHQGRVADDSPRQRGPSSLRIGFRLRFKVSRIAGHVSEKAIVPKKNNIHAMLGVSWLLIDNILKLLKKK